MRKHFFMLAAIAALSAKAQDPAISSWIINPGNETGYAGIATNVLSVHYTASDVYVTSTCIPGYDIGPWAGNPNTPANQDFCFRITRAPQPNTGNLIATALGHIGVWRNGVSIFNAKDGMSYNNQGIWNRDALVWEGSSFDVCLGHPAPNGEYHHHVSPNCLYDHLNDEAHSDLIGFAFDGYPIYGAYGFMNADGSGGITRMRSSYQLRSIPARTSLPDGTVLNAGQYGPAIGGQYPLGAYIEDYEYVAGSGDLDVHNGRFCVTPEYPAGVYAYFVTLTDQLAPAYPYVIGPTYYGTVPGGNTGPGSGHNTIPGNAVLYVPGTTSISEPEPMLIDAYPVPTASLVNLRSSGAAIASLELIDAQGRCVLSAAPLSTATVIDLSALSSGIYSVRTVLSEGMTSSFRIVRQ